MTEKEAKKYLQNHEFNIQKAFATYTIVELAFVSYARTDVIKGINFSPVFSYFDFSAPYPFYQIIRQDAIDNIIDKLYANFLKDRRSLDKVFNKQRQLSYEVDQVWNTYNKINNASNKEIFSTFQKMLEIAAKWWEFAPILEDKGEIINRKIVPKFEKKYKLNNNEAREIVFKLSHPSEQAIYNNERERFLKICRYFLNNITRKKELLRKEYKLILQDKKIVHSLNQYKKDFFWFKSDFYKAVEITNAGILSDVCREIKLKSEADIKNELKSINKNFKELIKEKKQLKGKMKLNKEEKDDIYFAERVIYWTDQRKLEMMKQLYYFSVMFEKIAKIFCIKYGDLAVYTLKELFLLMEKRIKISKSNVEKRHKSMISICEKNKTPKIIYGETAKRLLNIVQSAKTKEIKGTVASSGGMQKIKGKVCIISNPTTENFNEGEILVTSMTRIEFVPFIRIAKAIITDEGGMACHAAIVSREMRKPAVIGTKNATAVLKDGDEVEIDLKGGSVKILNK